MAQGAEYISNLIEYTVSAENVKPDLEACLEIADRANASKLECIETIKSIAKQLGKSAGQVVLNTLLLLETLCKNGNMRFLYELNNKKLVEAMMKILTKRRDRAKYGKKASQTTDKNKIEAEDKVLYLLQLWADTFMMHEDEFKNIHEAYRTLRKEGVKFPDRDPNMKYMINFQGQISPVFLAMEHNFIAPSNNQGGAPMDPKKKDNKPVVHQPEYKHEYEPNQVQNTLYNEEDDDDQQDFEGVEISEDEIKILEESLGILKEIELNATKPGDMKTEIAREILSDMVHVKKRISRLLQTEKFTQYQIKELTRLKEKINEYLMSYKSRYNLIKENFRLGIPTEPLAKTLQKARSEEEQQEEVEDNHTNKGNQHQEEDLLDMNGSHEENNTNINKPTHVQEETKKEDPKTKPTKKVEVVKGKILAPPSGWKNPVATKSNPDYLNLLDDPEEKNQGSGTNANNLITKESNLMDDLLNLQFNPNGSSNNQNKPNNQFNGMGQKIMNPGFGNGQMPNPINNLVTPQTNSQTNINTKKVEEDDDFFGSLANRK